VAAQERQVLSAQSLARLRQALEGQGLNRNFTAKADVLSDRCRPVGQVEDELAGRTATPNCWGPFTEMKPSQS
jgi:hypothetical protein